MDHTFEQKLAIAIDGPVAAGKGTIASLLAQKLPGFHLYTGAMYRCVALYCLMQSISFTDKQAIIAVLPHIDVDFDNDNNVLLNGEIVTEKIKMRDVANATPKVAALAQVREAMVAVQQKIGYKKMAQGKIVIAEGRDAATKIFPSARLKIFLTATPEVRAKRRFEQMGGTHNSSITYQQILADTKLRDERDTNRTTDPLVKDPAGHGYFVLDDSTLSEEQTIHAIMTELERERIV